jgi:hypothetical protein
MKCKRTEKANNNFGLNFKCIKKEVYIKVIYISIYIYISEQYYVPLFKADGRTDCLYRILEMFYALGP